MENEQADAGRTAEPVSRDQMIRRDRGQGNIHFPCSVDHEQDWQPYSVDPCSCYMRDYTYIHHPVAGATQVSVTSVSCASEGISVLMGRQIPSKRARQTNQPKDSLSDVDCAVREN